MVAGVGVLVGAVVFVVIDAVAAVVMLPRYRITTTCVVARWP